MAQAAEPRVDSLQTPPITVDASASLAGLPELLVQHRGCWTVGVVDEAGILVGIIPVDLVIQDLLFDVMPEELLTDLLEPDRAANLIRELHARTAGELMQPPVSVFSGATLRDAAHTLHQAELQGAPVVDETGRVTGYIALLDIMLAWWRRRHGG